MVQLCPVTLAIIDEEHRGIQQAIASLRESILLGAGAAKVMEAARHALRVTLLHFESEEEILQAIEFPELNQHRQDHAAITEVLERIAEELNSNNSTAALRSIRECRRSLMVHLQDEDERYRDAVNWHAAEQGIAPLPQRIRHAIRER